MNIQMRIELMSRLGEYMRSTDPGWQEAKQKASILNPWFTPGFIDLASSNIAGQFLSLARLEQWTASFTPFHITPRRVGIVMAGNIPLVGFHDLLSVFVAGHIAIVKPSSKDEILIKHIVEKLGQWNQKVNESIFFEDMLKGCDAYIATGSNSSARYFEYYFNKYPHIIRRNRTSVALLDGSESREELELLADDVHVYFGMGCRNVTKIFVPKDYDFVPMLSVFKK